MRLVRVVPLQLKKDISPSSHGREQMAVHGTNGLLVYMQLKKGISPSSNAGREQMVVHAGGTIN